MAEHIIFDFDPSKDSAYAQILATPGLCVVDSLNDILTELYKADFPDPDHRPITPQEYRLRELNGRVAEAYGKWVYYPWRNTLVHIPEEETFIRLRTIRNLYKITHEERDKLRQAKIGVIGLSVGHSVSMALAMERIAGEIRIADFDTLELGNMNRIRTGLHNLGIPKTTIVAREIAEIDPYIKVTCFPQGIDKENIESFFDDGGRLDVLVEECDSVEVKILARQVAKRKRVPVVMDTSDRLMIDIERYDLDPNYPIMHGMVDENLDYDFLKSLKSSKEKLPYILPFAGIDQISDRMAASALELGTTITSWPQLATEVQIGGALAAKACKQIILGEEKLNYGRYYHDNVNSSELSQFTPFELNRQVRKIEIQKRFGINSGGLKRNINLELIIQEATTSPSAANLQNWKFNIVEGRLIISRHKEFEKSVFDVNNLYSIFGLATLCSSIRIISSKYGLQALINTDFIDDCLIEISFNEVKSPVDWMYEHIHKRFTNRSNFNYQKIQFNILKDISKHFDQDNIHYITDSASIRELETIIGEFDYIRLKNSNTHKEMFGIELKTHIYHSNYEQHGLFLKDLGLSLTDELGLNLVKRENVLELLRNTDGGQAFKRVHESKTDDPCSYVIISGDLSSSLAIYNMGRVLFEYWIYCTKFEISLFPITSLVPILNSVKRSQNGYFEKERETVLQLDKKIMNICSSQNPDIAFLARLQKGCQMADRVRDKSFVKVQYV